MAKNPQVYNAGYNTIRDLMSSEYSLRDKINFFRGIINTFNHVYPQLYDIDLRSDYAKLDVPVYFFPGTTRFKCSDLIGGRIFPFVGST